MGLASSHNRQYLTRAPTARPSPLSLYLRSNKGSAKALAALQNSL